MATGGGHAHKPVVPRIRSRRLRVRENGIRKAAEIAPGCLLHVGLQDARRDDHRPLESGQDEIPLRDILLWAEELSVLPSREDTDGSGKKRHGLAGGGLD